MICSFSNWCEEIKKRRRKKAHLQVEANETNNKKWNKKVKPLI